MPCAPGPGCRRTVSPLPERTPPGTDFGPPALIHQPGQVSYEDVLTSCTHLQSCWVPLGPVGPHMLGCPRLCLPCLD